MSSWFDMSIIIILLSYINWDFYRAHANDSPLTPAPNLNKDNKYLLISN